MDLYQAIVSFLGDPPAGYEILVWLFSGFVLIFLLINAFGILSAFLDFLLGRRG